MRDSKNQESKNEQLVLENNHNGELIKSINYIKTHASTINGILDGLPNDARFNMPSGSRNHNILLILGNLFNSLLMDEIKIRASKAKNIAITNMEKLKLQEKALQDIEKYALQDIEAIETTHIKSYYITDTNSYEGQIFNKKTIDNTFRSIENYLLYFKLFNSYANVKEIFKTPQLVKDASKLFEEPSNDAQLEILNRIKRDISNYVKLYASAENGKEALTNVETILFKPDQDLPVPETEKTSLQNISSNFQKLDSQYQPEIAKYILSLKSISETTETTLSQAPEEEEKFPVTKSTAEILKDIKLDILEFLKRNPNYALFTQHAKRIADEDGLLDLLIKEPKFDISNCVEDSPELRLLRQYQARPLHTQKMFALGSLNYSLVLQIQNNFHNLKEASHKGEIKAYIATVINKSKDEIREEKESIESSPNSYNPGVAELIKTKMKVDILTFISNNCTVPVPCYPGYTMPKGYIAEHQASILEMLNLITSNLVSEIDKDRYEELSDELKTSYAESEIYLFNAPKVDPFAKIISYFKNGDNRGRLNDEDKNEIKEYIKNWYNKSKDEIEVEKQNIDPNKIASYFYNQLNESIFLAKYLSQIPSVREI